MSKDNDIKKQTVQALVKFVAIELLLVSLVILIGFYTNALGELEEVREALLSYVPFALMLILTIVSINLVLSLMRIPFERSMRRHVGKHADIIMLWKLISYIAWFLGFALLFLVSIENRDFLGISLGVIAAALIYILAKPLLNLTGWFSIVIKRPCKIGDRIEIDGKQGYVIDITLGHFVVREFGGWLSGDSFTGRTLHVPNNAIYDHPLINYTKSNTLIYDEVSVSITYESDQEQAEEVMLNIVRGIVGDKLAPELLEPVRKREVKDLLAMLPTEPIVYYKFAPSSIDMSVVYFVSTKDRRKVASEVTKNILSQFKEIDGISIAYPHIELVQKME